MDKIKLYSIGCPKCEVLKKKLIQANINFEEISNFDEDDLIAQGIDSMPVLVVNGKFLEFKDAVEWLKGNS